MQFEMFIQTSLPESRLQPVTATHRLKPGLQRRGCAGV